MRAPVLLALVALSAASCADHEQINKLCPTVESTGGDPTGDWTITAYCQVPYGRTTTDDWCSKLVYDEMGVEDGLFLGQEVLPLSTTMPSTIKYMRETACGENCGTYEAQFIYEGKTTTHFPRGCLSQHRAPADANCADLETKINELALNVLPLIEPNSVKCADEPDGSGGCACEYLFSTGTVAADVGAWRVRDGLLTHYPSAPAQLPPELTDIAISGNQMQLHGHEGVPLFAREPLRFLQLQKNP